MQHLQKYQEALKKALEQSVVSKNPKGLYEPLQYILSLGGKRLRPLLTLMTADYFGTPFEKAMNAALAVELFHNFSLIHDDIMDSAPLRRGKPTVHTKWDVNTGILSGDAMLILAYRYFESYEPQLFSELARLFSETAIQVCEGQQYDLDFEERDSVAQEEYIHMIEYKTAVLVGAAMKMGAMVAGTSLSNKELIYRFGRDLGIAFQLQDDYLDAFGDPKTFGKQVGGDIIENKKTILYISGLNMAGPSDKNELLTWYQQNSDEPEQKVAAVKQLFERSGAANFTLSEVKRYTEQANAVLDEIELPEADKDKLREFSSWLMSRKT